MPQATAFSAWVFRRLGVHGVVFVASAPLPRLELPALTGETIGLDDYRGRPVLVSFLRHAG